MAREAMTKLIEGGELTEVDDLFAQHIRQARAVAQSWRKIVRSTAGSITLTPFLEQVTTKCPDADAAYVRGELKRRLKH